MDQQDNEFVHNVYRVFSGGGGLPTGREFRYSVDIIEKYAWFLILIGIRFLQEVIKTEADELQRLRILTRYCRSVLRMRSVVG